MKKLLATIFGSKFNKTSHCGWKLLKSLWSEDIYQKIENIKIESKESIIELGSKFGWVQNEIQKISELMKTSIVEQSQNQPWMTDLKKLQEATGHVQKKFINSQYFQN